MDLKRDYKQDLRLFDDRAKLIAFLALACALILFPLASFYIPAGSYYTNVLNMIAVNAIVAIGLNILVGYTGQISLGHAGFFAIGAYVEAVLFTQHGIPIPLALPAAGLTAGLFGLLLGLPALRLEGPYLAVATLGFGLAVVQIIGRLDFFGGRMGLSIPAPGHDNFVAAAIKILVSPEKAVDSPNYSMYIMIIPVTVLSTIAAVNLMKSKIGRAFTAIRDSEIAAEAIGVNLVIYKTAAFAVSAFFTGIAGGLYAHLMGFINPESFDMRLSITFLAIVVVGGLGSVLGSILGAILMTLLPISLTAVSSGPDLIYGAILIMVILFEPLGLRGRWLKIKYFWKAWPF